MEQGALQSQASTTLNRDTDLEERLSQLVYDNETLKIEVGRLQGILERSGALKAHELQTENETQRRTIDHLTTQLAEKEQQLCELRSANTRFANIDATVQNFLIQLQAQQEEMTRLKQALDAKEGELDSVRGQMAELVQRQAASETNEATAATRARLQAMEETNAKLQRELDAAQRRADEATQKLSEAATTTQQHQEQEEHNMTALQAREKGAQDELAALRESHAKTTQQLASLQVAHNTLHAQLQAKQAELEKAVQTCKEGRAATRTLTNNTTGDEDADFDEAVLTPRMKAYVQRCIAQATAGVEQRLREQTDLNASLLAFKAMVQNEKEIHATRENETKEKASPVAQAPANAERAQLRNKQQEAYQEMQRRVSQVLAADKLSKRDIQHLLQEMLDYQEGADEDMRTRLLIKDIQAEEMTKLQEGKIKRLEAENGSLLKQLRDAMQAAQAPARASLSRNTTPRQQPQQPQQRTATTTTTTIVPILTDRQRSISPGTQACSSTSSHVRALSGSPSTSAGVTPLYARQPSVPLALYGTAVNSNTVSSISSPSAGGTMSPRWAGGASVGVTSGPAMGVPIIPSRPANGLYASSNVEEQQQQQNAALRAANTPTTMMQGATPPMNYHYNPSAGMQATGQAAVGGGYSPAETNAAPGRGMIMCPACSYWQLNANQTCCCCGRILPRH